MLSDDEIDAIYIEHRGDGGPTAMCENFARAIIAAYQAKLLAGVELPEPYGKVAHEERPYEPAWISSEDAYTADQLQQYAAAAAAQARMKALDEAKGVCEAEFTVEGIL